MMIEACSYRYRETVTWRLGSGKITTFNIGLEKDCDFLSNKYIDFTEVLTTQGAFTPHVTFLRS